MASSLSFDSDIFLAGWAPMKRRTLSTWSSRFSCTTRRMLCRTENHIATLNNNSATAKIEKYQIVQVLDRCVVRAASLLVLPDEVSKPPGRMNQPRVSGSVNSYFVAIARRHRVYSLQSHGRIPKWPPSGRVEGQRDLDGCIRCSRSLYSVRERLIAIPARVTSCFAGSSSRSPTCNLGLIAVVPRRVRARKRQEAPQTKMA